MSPIDLWRRIIIDAGKSWVLFESGTCVILVEPEAGLAAQALALLKEGVRSTPGARRGTSASSICPTTWAGS